LLLAVLHVDLLWLCYAGMLLRRTHDSEIQIRKPENNLRALYLLIREQGTHLCCLWGVSLLEPSDWLNFCMGGG
jgi:hypothetical protein